MTWEFEITQGWQISALGFTGLYCETNVNDRECASGEWKVYFSRPWVIIEYDSFILAPCMNGGHCKSRAGGFTCECSPGFTGDRCQTNINECASLPCENNATCVDGVGHYACNCLPGNFKICSVIFLSDDNTNLLFRIHWCPLRNKYRRSCMRFR